MRTAPRAGPIAATTVTPTPTGSPTSTVRGSKTSGPGGSVIPNPRSSASQPERGQHAQAQADHRGNQPGDGRLAEHGAEHLAAARADDPQQGQLPGALPDDDRERVEDGEPADEQRDEREDQQRGGEEGQRLVDRAGALVHHGLPGDHLHAGGQDLGDGLLHRGLAGARRGHHVDVVELAGLLGDGLRGRQRERGQGRPGQVVRRPELGDAGDGERPGRPGGQDADLLPYGEVVLLRGPGVHHHVVGGGRGAAGDQVQAGELRIGVEADGRGWARRRSGWPCRRGRRTGRSP